MSRAHPYRRPSGDVLRATPWALTTREGTTVLPENLPTWDYDTVLSLHRSISIDGARARRESGLGGDSVLALSVRWRSVDSQMRGRAWQRIVPDRDGVDLQAEFELGGSELGGVLELVLTLTLVHPGSDPSAVAPRRPASLLWEDSYSVQLQGGATHFPVAVADFEELPYPSDSSWFLQIGEDLDAAALGSLLLVVNERRRLVMEVLAGTHEPDTATAVLSVLRAEVLRGLVEHALTDQDFDDEVDHPRGSVGALLTAVLHDRFPVTGLEDLRREREQDPGLFSARVQAAAGLFGPGR